MFRVALTGGIASGKSTAAARLAELGAVVIDTDVLAREVVTPGSEGLDAVVQAFGHDILTDDGRLNRAAMRELVFSDSYKKQELEAILHPRIRALLAQRSAHAGGPYQVFEIPLLAESGHRFGVNRVLVIDCDVATQRARVMARDNIDAQRANAILAQQATREQRLAIADDVIDNNGDVHSLSQAMYKLHPTLPRACAQRLMCCPTRHRRSADFAVYSSQFDH